MKSNIQFRLATPADTIQCGQICFDAFASIAQQHLFPSEFPCLNATVATIGSMIENEGFYSVVAERNGKIIGSNFLDERGAIVGIGPISVDPDEHNSGIGRQLMQMVIDRAIVMNKSGIRLNTAAHHGRTLALYSKLGFKIQAPVIVLQGQQIKACFAQVRVRQAEPEDLFASSQICHMTHGYDRQSEVQEAISLGSACVVEREGRITGYTTGVSFFGHTVGETNEDIKALIAATTEYQGVGFLIPALNYELLNWCLKHGLRIVMSMNYMSTGLYNTPRSPYLPGILY